MPPNNPADQHMYDRGYADAKMGVRPRSEHPWYSAGYIAGLQAKKELDDDEGEE
jgi:hypothetical protein